MEFVKIEKTFFKSVLRDLQTIDRIASKKANVGANGKYSVEDTESLTIACIATAIMAELDAFHEDIECTNKSLKPS